MRIATRQIGRWDKSRNTIAEEIYGTLRMSTPRFEVNRKKCSVPDKECLKYKRRNKVVQS